METAHLNAWQHLPTAQMEHGAITDLGRGVKTERGNVPPPGKESGVILRPFHRALCLTPQQSLAHLPLSGDISPLERLVLTRLIPPANFPFS